MKNIVIVGGTHGNEWTGVYLVKHFAEKLKKSFPDLNLDMIHGNPHAFTENRRFTQEDLNRVFEAINKEHNTGTYEYKRGLEIKEKILSHDSPWLIDLHTTTANLGSTLIITQDRTENFKLAAAVQKKLPHLKIIFSPDPIKKYLVSQAPLGLMIEVGPIANSIVDTRILNETKTILDEILRSLNLGEELNFEGEVEVFEEVKDVFYPTGPGGITAGIHPKLQHQDFMLLGQGFPLFLSFDESEIPYEEAEELYPIFINEAAYYRSNIAFGLCRKSVRVL